jgi:hypothetical protein
VFLLLLCNDKAVLGPWVNGSRLNLFTGAVVACLVMLSVILTASVLYPAISDAAILGVLVGGSAVALVTTACVKVFERRREPVSVEPVVERVRRDTWRMPPLAELPPARLTLLNRVWLIVLRGYLVVAGGLVLLRIVQLATAGG